MSSSEWYTFEIFRVSVVMNVELLWKPFFMLAHYWHAGSGCVLKTSGSLFQAIPHMICVQEELLVFHTRVLMPANVRLAFRECRPPFCWILPNVPCCRWLFGYVLQLYRH